MFDFGMIRSAFTVALLALPFVGCTAQPTRDAAMQGHLMLVGGGLESDSRFFFDRFLELARAHRAPHVLIATAATGDQDEAATEKIESLRVWAKDVKVSVIRRETTTAETVAQIDSATAMFFTGGDQTRITDRYRPNDQPTPEWEAMRRLLARGGVIAGGSAGDAMMGSVMFFTGRSAQALGIPRKDADPDDAEANKTGPRIGPGMYFLPWAVTDSHFWERDRIGRLAAALEVTRGMGGQTIGLGVGEDACVEIDLATGQLVGASPSETLLVDARALVRDGKNLRNGVARCVQQGDRIDAQAWSKTMRALPPRPAGQPREVRVIEPGQSRQLASWQQFRQASVPGSGAIVVRYEGWRVIAWPDGNGNAAFDIEVEQ